MKITDLMFLDQACLHNFHFTVRVVEETEHIVSMDKSYISR